jgi:hypothetical protein
MNLGWHPVRTVQVSIRPSQNPACASCALWCDPMERSSFPEAEYPATAASWDRSSCSSRPSCPPAGRAPASSPQGAPDTDELHRIGDQVAAGQLTPMIDRRFPLEQAADSIRYLETEHARAKVVINVAGPTPSGDPIGSEGDFDVFESER